MALIVLDIPRLLPHCSSSHSLTNALRWENQLVQSATKYGVTPMLLFNAKDNQSGPSQDRVVDAIRSVHDSGLECNQS